MNEINSICKQHTGLIARINNLEGNVSTLWKKLDSIQKIIITILTALSLNLIGIIVILIKI